MDQTIFGRGAPWLLAGSSLALVFCGAPVLAQQRAERSMDPDRSFDDRVHLDPNFANTARDLVLPKTVPDLYGLTCDEARDRLARRRLELDCKPGLASGGSAGRINDQVPRRDAATPANRLVTAFLEPEPPAPPPPRPKVPDLSGLTCDRARDLLARQQLRLSCERGDALGGQAGRINRQDPGADADAPADGLVTAFLEPEAPAPVPPALKVPDLAGLTCGEARDLLAGHGLRANCLRGRALGGSSGRINRQDPGPGADAPPSGLITAYLEPERPVPPPPRPEVPELTGRTCDEARVLLAGLAVGLRLHCVVRWAIPMATPTIEQQTPAAGSRVREGTEVVAIASARIPVSPIAVAAVSIVAAAGVAAALRGRGKKPDKARPSRPAGFDLRAEPDLEPAVTIRVKGRSDCSPRVDLRTEPDEGVVLVHLDS